MWSSLLQWKWGGNNYLINCKLSSIACIHQSIFIFLKEIYVLFIYLFIVCLCLNLNGLNWSRNPIRWSYAKYRILSPTKNVQKGNQKRFPTASFVAFTFFFRGPLFSQLATACASSCRRFWVTFVKHEVSLALSLSHGSLDSQASRCSDFHILFIGIVQLVSFICEAKLSAAISIIGGIQPSITKTMMHVSTIYKSSK